MEKNIQPLLDKLKIMDLEVLEMMKDSKYWNDSPKAGSFFCQESFTKHSGELMIIAGERRKIYAELKKLGIDNPEKLLKS